MLNSCCVSGRETPFSDLESAKKPSSWLSESMALAKSTLEMLRSACHAAMVLRAILDVLYG